MNFINNLFETIKCLFKGKELKDNKEIQNISKEKLIENYNKLFEQIEIGDIIWAKRYKNEEEKEKILEGHREGPFIVLQKEEEKLICSKGTSVIQDDEFYNIYFYLYSENTNLIKDTYFQLNEPYFIDNYSLIKIIGKLNIQDKEQLFRKIKKSHIKIPSLNLPIQTGDIVNVYNKNFIVIDCINNYILCLPLKSNYKFNPQIILNDLDFANAVCFEINHNINYVNTVDTKSLMVILKRYKKYINHCKNVNITQRGSVIFLHDKYYYVYGDDGQDWLVFQIIKENILESEKIKIGNKLYYTNYRDERIRKIDSFDNIYLCSEEEKNTIKKMRKSYREKQKNKCSKQRTRYRVGDIIENINDINKNYIIINIHKEEYECLEIDKIKNAIYTPKFINNTEVKLASNYNLEGIKWLEEHKNFNLNLIGSKEILNEIFIEQKHFIKKIEIKKAVVNQIIGEEYNSDLIGSLIKTNEFTDEIFFVKEVLGDMVVCVSRIDLGTANPKKHYFNKNNIIVLKKSKKRK